jgi:hypothetical protein
MTDRSIKGYKTDRDRLEIHLRPIQYNTITVRPYHELAFFMEAAAENKGIFGNTIT